MKKCSQETCFKRLHLEKLEQQLAFGRGALTFDRRYRDTNHITNRKRGRETYGLG
jgi:hypothetical protein